MNIGRNKKTIASAGALACLVCFIGPIIGVLSAIGVGTAVGYVVFGGAWLIAGAIAAIYVIRRRKQQQQRESEPMLRLRHDRDLAMEHGNNSNNTA